MGSIIIYTKSLEKLLDYKDSRMHLEANKYLQGITHKRSKYKEAGIRRTKKNEFLNKTFLSEEEKMIAFENIFIGLNTNLFSEII